MARINGANSDFVYANGSVVELEPKPNPLFMKIFICPYDQPSALQEEDEDNTCDGTDDGCPESGTTAGHAMIQLHQANGIELVTDSGNTIVIDQVGNIRLENPQGAKIVLGNDGNITIDAPTVTISGNLNVDMINGASFP